MPPTHLFPEPHPQRKTTLIPYFLQAKEKHIASPRGVLAAPNRSLPKLGILNHLKYQGTKISHLGKQENHRLKNALDEDKLVPTLNQSGGWITIVKMLLLFIAKHRA